MNILARSYYKMHVPTGHTICICPQKRIQTFFNLVGLVTLKRNWPRRMVHFFVLGSSLLYPSRKRTDSERAMPRCIPCPVAMIASGPKQGTSSAVSLVWNLDSPGSVRAMAADVSEAKISGCRRNAKNTLILWEGGNFSINKIFW